MDINTLKTFIDTHPIPVSVNSDGFLEIIRKQHHENINSSIYAHFINCSEEAVSSAFIGALVKLIKEKSGKEFTLTDVFAQTEVDTGLGRIDILIREKSGNQTIIIENKIYHHLDNDLLDYWNFVKVNEKEKVGVLLTLNKHQTDLEYGYINITHSEWITEVKNSLNISELPLNYQVYVSDFIRTIENLSTSYAMNESAKFYFEHAKQMLSAQETVYEAHAFLNNQFEIVASELGWATHGSSAEWRNIWDAKNDIDTYLTFKTDGLLKGYKKLTIYIEINREDKDREIEIEEKIVNNPQVQKKYKGKPEGSFLPLLCKDYLLTDIELENLGQTLFTKIREDFGNVLVEIIEFLYPDKNISEWKQKFQMSAIQNVNG